MKLIKKNTLLSLLLLPLTFQVAYGASDALDVLTPDDIYRSSDLVRKTFIGTYEPSAKLIEDPAINETIGQISFSEKQVDITFRATLSNPKEFISNLNFTYASLQELNFSDNEAKAHAGFVAAANRIKDFVSDTIYNYKREASLKSEEMTIIVHGQSRGTGLGTLTAAYLKGLPEYLATTTYVLNYAPLPLFNVKGQEKCHFRLGRRNILNFICEEDAIQRLVTNATKNNFKITGIDIPFSAADYPEFQDRIGKYTHLSNKLLIIPLALGGIDNKGWEGHMPETYLHSSDAFRAYKQSHT